MSASADRFKNPMHASDGGASPPPAAGPAVASLELASLGKAFSLGGSDLLTQLSMAKTRLIYGKQGTVVSESMEDEASPMVDGADADGGDGAHEDEDDEEKFDESNGQNRKEQRDEGEEIMLRQMQSMHIISPTSNFRSQWDLCQAVFLIYIALTVPWRIGFGQPAEAGTFWFMFDLGIDIYFWVDLVLNFRTAVYTREGELEMAPKRIAQIYMRGWFPIDLVSCLPFSYVVYIVPGAQEDGVGGGENKAIKLLRLMRLLKLMRLVRFKRILDRWEEELYSVGAIKFGKLLMVIFLSAHWVACAWYSVGVDEDSGLVDSDGSKIMGWVTKKFDGTADEPNPANQTSLSFRYLIAYYWALMNIMTVDSNDGGDIFPRTVSERIMSSVSMLVGGFTFGLIVGSLSDMVRRSNPGDTAKQKQLGFVHAFVHERKVPPVLTRKIRGFFAGNYTQHGTVFDERKFFDKMPQDLREELGLHLQYIDHGGGGKRNGILWKVPFFETLGHTDMIRICSQLKYLRVQPPEFDENGRPDHSHYIMKQGEHTNDMFVIIEGMVRVERNRKPLGKLRQYDYFGEMGVLLEERPGYPLRRLRSAYALTPNTFMGFLGFDDLHELRKESPAIDHAVAAYAYKAAERHPSLHPTDPELDAHDHDDLLPPPSLRGRPKQGQLLADYSGGGGGGMSEAEVKKVVGKMGRQWETDRTQLETRLQGIEASQKASSDAMAAQLARIEAMLAS